MHKKSKKKLPTSTNVLSREPGPDLDYRASGDCMTLKSAEEIRRDTARHRAAKAHAKKELKSLNAICK